VEASRSTKRTSAGTSWKQSNDRFQCSRGPVRSSRPLQLSEQQREESDRLHFSAFRNDGESPLHRFGSESTTSTWPHPMRLPRDLDAWLLPTEIYSGL
jgi:hypothetical protein